MIADPTPDVHSREFARCMARAYLREVQHLALALVRADVFQAPATRRETQAAFDLVFCRASTLRSYALTSGDWDVITDAGDHMIAASQARRNIFARVTE